MTNNAHRADNADSNADDGRPGNDSTAHGRKGNGGRIAKAAAVYEGAKKAVDGQETIIRANAAGVAKKLDAKFEGRHTEKIRAALAALDFVVDHLGSAEGGERGRAIFDRARGADASRGTDQSERSGRTGNHSSQSTGESPEDLGDIPATEHGSTSRR